MKSYCFYLVFLTSLVLKSSSTDSNTITTKITTITEETTKTTKTPSSSTIPTPEEGCPEVPYFNISQTNGTWYEYKRTTDFIGKGTCTRFSVLCENTTYCAVEVSEKPENQTMSILAHDENVKNATIFLGQNKMPGVHIKTDKDSILLWQCEQKVNESGYMYQASIWHTSVEVNDTIVKDLLDYLPAFTWDVVNQTCPSSSTKLTFTMFHILFLVITILTIVGH